MKPLKHFKFKAKQDYKTRLVLFGIFMILSALCFGLDYILFTGAGVVPGILTATIAAAAAGTENEVIEKLKNALTGFNLADPDTRNGLQNMIGNNGNAESSQKVVDKLDELLNAYKDSNKKPAEPTAKNSGIYRLLTDHELTSDDKDEKNRLAYNRYIRGIYNITRNSASPEILEAFAKMRDDAKHGIQNTGVNADGLYTIPTPMFNLLVDNLRASGIFMNDLTTVRMTRRMAVAPVLLASGHPAPSHKDEATPSTAKKYSVGTFTFGTQTFRVKDNGIIVPWTNEMDFDSIVNISELINAYVNEWFNILGDTYLFRGNNQAGDAKITGLYEYVSSMVPIEMDTTAFNSLKLDNFIDADGAVRSVDKPGMKRYMSPSVHSIIKKAKDANDRYQLDSAERLAGKIEGIPVTESDSCYAASETGANKACVINANLKKSFLAMLEGGGIEVLQTNVATWNDGTRDFNAFQENLWAIRINLPFDIVHPFVSRYSVIHTKA